MRNVKRVLKDFVYIFYFVAIVFGRRYNNVIYIKKIGGMVHEKEAKRRRDEDNGFSDERGHNVSDAAVACRFRRHG